MFGTSPKSLADHIGLVADDHRDVSPEKCASAVWRTCSIMDRPAIGWSTLGSADFIRVPWPAARIDDVSLSASISYVQFSQVHEPRNRTLPGRARYWSLDTFLARSTIAYTRRVESRCFLATARDRFRRDSRQFLSIRPEICDHQSESSTLRWLSSAGTIGPTTTVNSPRGVVKRCRKLAGRASRNSW